MDGEQLLFLATALGGLIGGGLAGWVGGIRRVRSYDRYVRSYLEQRLGNGEGGFMAEWRDFKKGATEAFAEMKVGLAEVKGAVNARKEACEATHKGVDQRFEHMEKDLNGLGKRIDKGGE